MNAQFNARFDGAEVVSVFGSPDMSILTAGRRPAVPMPSEVFGPAWGLLNDFALDAGCPVDYPAIGFLTAAASLIGGKRMAKPYESSNWLEPCILWAGAVGDPSSGKSPGLDMVTAPLRKIEREYTSEYNDTIRIWTGDVERAKQERDSWQMKVKEAVKIAAPTPPMPPAAVAPDEPQRRRMIITDATPEAVVSILAGNPTGTLHLRDELAGWLSSFDRYSPGGRAYWLEAYGGRPYVIDRKSQLGAPTIDFNGVSVVGSIQPERLAATLLQSVDDGLVPRFLWAWPERIPFQRPQKGGDVRKLETIYSRLDSLQWAQTECGKPCAMNIHLEPSAADLFDTWRQENDRGIEDAGALYKNFCGKLAGMILRISLVAEHLKWAWTGGEPPHIISRLTVASACDFVDSYAKPMALRVFGDAVLPDNERNAAVIGRYIIKNKITRLNARELKRNAPAYHGPKKAIPLNEALDLLVEANWIRSSGVRDGTSPGRGTSDYIVNPLINHD